MNLLINLSNNNKDFQPNKIYQTANRIIGGYIATLSMWHISMSISSLKNLQKKEV